MMPLSDTQLLLLAAAAKRDDGSIVLSDQLTGRARENVLHRLFTHRLIEQVEPTPDAPRPLGCDEPLIGLRITAAGLAAIGVDANDGDRLPEDGCEGAPLLVDKAGGATEKLGPAGAAAATAPQRSVKLSLVLDLLRRPEGASLDELMATTGWQRHSVRGVIAGTVKKKLGHAVVTEKRDGIRSYRIEA